MKRNSDGVDFAAEEANTQKQVQGIYADEFNLNDSNGSFEYLERYPENTGSVNDYQCLVENLPDNAAMRNTVHGAGGFFEQRNQKINTKQGLKQQSYALQQLQPQFNTHKKQINKLSLERAKENMDSQMPAMTSSNLPALSKTGVNFFTGGSMTSNASPDLDLDRKSKQSIYQQHQNVQLNALSRREQRASLYGDKDNSASGITNQSPMLSSGIGPELKQRIVPATGYQTFTNFVFMNGNQGGSGGSHPRQELETQGSFKNPNRKYKIKFQINTKNDMPIDEGMMQAVHKENLNLLFYDFNQSSKQNARQQHLKPITGGAEDQKQEEDNEVDP